MRVVRGRRQNGELAKKHIRYKSWGSARSMVVTPMTDEETRQLAKREQIPIEGICCALIRRIGNATWCPLHKGERK